MSRDVACQLFAVHGLRIAEMPEPALFIDDALVRVIRGGSVVQTCITITMAAFDIAGDCSRAVKVHSISASRGN